MLMMMAPSVKTLTMLVVLLLAWVQHSSCATRALRSAHATTTRLRVRKEIRNLSDREYAMYLQGLSTMMSVQLDVGKALFGPNYVDMDTFVVLHACNALTPNGAANAADIAHFGPWFMTFHKVLEYSFEASLLSVVPGLKALPYWKMYEDMSSGKFYNTSQGIFTPGGSRFAGSLPGDPAYGYAVMDGPFGGRQAPLFNYLKFASTAYIYNGSVTGFLRGPNNLNNNTRFVRYPASFATSEGPTGPLSQGVDMAFNRSTFMHCANPNLVKSAWDFISCIDLPASMFNGLPTNSTWLGNPAGSQHAAFTHSMFHSITGSVGPNNGYVDAPQVPYAAVEGGAKDLATSPNEVLLFMPHHANLDRLWMIWQKSIAKIDPSQASRDVLWGYPKKATNTPPITLNHTALFDEISYVFPFTITLPGAPTRSGNITHYDVLMWKPDYKYDDMTPY